MHCCVLAHPGLGHPADASGPLDEETGVVAPLDVHAMRNSGSWFFRLGHGDFESSGQEPFTKDAGIVRVCGSSAPTRTVSFAPAIRKMAASGREFGSKP